MTARVFGAIDIGASGGRVMAGVVEGGRTTLHTVHRFPNVAEPRDGHLRWDLTGLFAQVLTGLRALASGFPDVESLGIDTWAVDYGLLDDDGRLLAEPVAYRDDRTGDAVERVHALLDPETLFAENGLQFLPFNTLYQLEAERDGALWQRARHVVLLPDLLAYWLTGQLRTELTNASTTGLLDVRTRGWSSLLMERLGHDESLFPPLVRPGEVVGPLLATVRDQTGLSPEVVLTTVASHDTASAVVALPATDRRFAYVSSGTWSLAGLELDKPVLSTGARGANFTNEGGVDDRYRFLRNIGGLWLLQESLRSWAERGVAHDVDSLLTGAQTLPSGGPVVNVDDPAFIAPGDMPARIAAAARKLGERPPVSPAETVRCVLDSLAAAYARAVDQAADLTGHAVEAIHVVGGGSRNALLAQLTADLSGRIVTSGPVEATALGNVLVQARAHGAAPPTLEEIRAQLATTQRVNRFTPA